MDILPPINRAVSPTTNTRRTTSSERMAQLMIPMAKMDGRETHPPIHLALQREPLPTEQTVEMVMDGLDPVAMEATALGRVAMAAMGVMAIPAEMADMAPMAMATRMEAMVVTAGMALTAGAPARVAVAAMVAAVRATATVAIGVMVDRAATLPITLRAAMQEPLAAQVAMGVEEQAMAAAATVVQGALEAMGMTTMEAPAEPEAMGAIMVEETETAERPVTAAPEVGQAVGTRVPMGKLEILGTRTVRMAKTAAIRLGKTPPDPLGRHWNASSTSSVRSSRLSPG